MEFITDTTEKTRSYFNITLKLAGVGQILASNISIIQIAFSMMNLSRYTLICCQSALNLASAPISYGFVSSFVVVGSMYYLISRLYNEATAVPKFQMSEKYYNHAHMYASVILKGAWSAASPSMALSLLGWSRFGIVMVDKGLGSICTDYPNTMQDVSELTAAAIQRLDEDWKWAPGFLVDYFGNRTGAGFQDEQELGTKALAEVEALAPVYNATQNQVYEILAEKAKVLQSVNWVYSANVNSSALDKCYFEEGAL
jgi:hypothetical protein